MTRSFRESSQQLYELAEQQQGYFTTKQAKAAGFTENTHPYHVRAGNWVREHRGIYRLRMFPSTERPDLALWSLWSRNRKEETEGVYSHQTALSLHELSDLNPAKLHMTVPRDFRRNSPIPDILVLHYGDLSDTDIQNGPGYQFTKPLRTLLDLLTDRSVEEDLLVQAIRQAVDRGLLSSPQIRSVETSHAVRTIFNRALSGKH
ncbi:MAG: type IV toxin-antitoxin system AbiEi family antitoxin domain-containing protein [Acidobacteriaceae bacterium]|nr:type IV toxin-antitoxin system AbiEi family antitoxin domain-containing protein [Acidobacteriaceae bacterium]